MDGYLSMMKQSMDIRTNKHAINKTNIGYWELNGNKQGSL